MVCFGRTRNLPGLLDIAATTWAHELEVVVCCDQVGGKYGFELFNFLNRFNLRYSLSTLTQLGASSSLELETDGH